MMNLENNKDKTKQPTAEVAGAENQNENEPTSKETVSFEPVPFDGVESETIARDIKEGRLSCFVGSGTALSGELNFSSMARIDGHLTGKVISDKGTLIVGTSGQVDAGISVATAIINGTINGDVTTAEHLELKSTAKIIGNIRTPRLIMEDGAILEGNCVMLKAEDKPASKQFSAAAGSQGLKNASSSAGQEDNASKDRKRFEPVETKKESSPLTLDVI